MLTATWGWNRTVMTHKIKLIIIAVLFLLVMGCRLADPSLDATLKHDEDETRMILEWRLNE